MSVDPESGLTSADDTPVDPDAIVLDDAGLIPPQEVGRRHRRKQKDAARAAAIAAGFLPPPAAVAETALNSPAGTIALPTGYRVEWAAVRVDTGRKQTITLASGRVVEAPVIEFYRNGEIVPATIPSHEAGRLIELESISPYFGPLPDRPVTIAGA